MVKKSELDKINDLIEIMQLVSCEETYILCEVLTSEYIKNYNCKKSHLSFYYLLYDNDLIRINAYKDTRDSISWFRYSLNQIYFSGYLNLFGKCENNR